MVFSAGVDLSRRDCVCIRKLGSVPQCGARRCRWKFACFARGPWFGAAIAPYWHVCRIKLSSFSLRQDQARDHPFPGVLSFRCRCAVSTPRFIRAGSRSARNGALMVESAGSGVAIENPPRLGLLSLQSHSEPPTSTRLW